MWLDDLIGAYMTQYGQNGQPEIYWIDIQTNSVNLLYRFLLMNIFTCLMYNINIVQMFIKAYNRFD